MTTIFENRISDEQLVDGFAQFTSLIHPGQKPYSWQNRLVRDIAATGAWPAAIVAPTGSGKSRVIDVHVFLQAKAGLGEVDPSLPRRLALIVDRRALVDSQYQDALELRDALEREAADGHPDAMQWVDGLRRRGGQATDGTALKDEHTPPLLIVANLRGGQVSKDPMMAEWRNHPEVASVLCFTPDMFGSRLLFSGYGVGTGGRPIEAGLLAYDTVAVIDEAHLCEQLSFTSQQVPRIESHAATPLGKTPLQTVVTTATPDLDNAEARTIGVEESDLADDDGLRRRLTSPKPVTAVELSPGDKKAASLADLARQLRSRVHGTVGVVVNTVKVAGQVSSLLRDATSDDEVVTIVGRMRPADRLDIEERHSGLFGPDGDPGVAFVVGTQTLEVGLDMSFAGMVTELASGSALAQRAGRVNRFGLLDEGPIIVGIPCDAELNDKKNIRPYGLEERLEAREWVSSLSDDGLSPWNVSNGRDRPPHAERHRMILQRIEDWDIENLCATGDKVYGEERLGTVGPTGVDLWIRDDLSSSVDIGLVVRTGLPELPGQAAQLIDALPILDEEVLPVPFGLAIQWLEKLEVIPRTDSDSDADAGSRQRRESCPRVFVVKPDEPTQELRTKSQLSADCQLVIDDSTPGFSGFVFDVEGVDVLPDVLERSIVRRNSILASAAAARHEEKYESRLSYALPIHVGRAEGRGGRSVHPLLEVSEDSLLDLASELRQIQNVKAADSELDQGSREEISSDPLNLFTSWLIEHDLDRSELLLSQFGAALPENASLSRLLERCSATVQFIGSDDLDDEFTIVIVSSTSSSTQSDREIATTGGDPVLLKDHQRDVANQAVHIAQTCGMSEFSEVLHEAGLLHDEGKRDPRFQELLRLGDRRMRGFEDALAKSRFRSPSRERSFRQSVGLRGWRHEQRSAAVAWSLLSRSRTAVRELVTRLAGTTHGYGRTSFPDGSAALLAKSTTDGLLIAAAEELFDHGGWETLVERTTAQYGFWGIAYLEGLLRAADVQISQKGQ
jgi:CRISPR-associated endonuclease/helicase Cas3